MNGKPIKCPECGEHEVEATLKVYIEAITLTKAACGDRSAEASASDESASHLGADIDFYCEACGDVSSDELHSIGHFILDSGTTYGVA